MKTFPEYNQEDYDSLAKCPTCGNLVVRIDQYDGDACKNCNIWFSSKCVDDSCEFCSKRPDFPNSPLIDWNSEFNNYLNKKRFNPKK